MNRDEALQKLHARLASQGKEALLDSATQERILSTLALLFIFRTANKVQHELQARKSDSSAAWNLCMADLVLCSKFHCLLYIFRSLVAVVRSASKQGTTDLLLQLTPMNGMFTLFQARMNG